MKSISLGIVLILLLIGFVTQTASAHVLEYDGSIAAVLHINPDDSPINALPTSYILYFTDDTNRFTLPACDCTVSFQLDGKIIATKKLVNTSDTTSTNIYTFPKAGTYNLIVSGKPIKPRAFSSFTLTYDVRVGSDAVETQPFPPLLWVGLGSMIWLIILGGYASEHSSTKKT